MRTSDPAGSDSTVREPVAGVAARDSALNQNAPATAAAIANATAPTITAIETTAERGFFFSGSLGNVFSASSDDSTAMRATCALFSITHSASGGSAEWRTGARNVPGKSTISGEICTGRSHLAPWRKTL